MADPLPPGYSIGPNGVILAENGQPSSYLNSLYPNGFPSDSTSSPSPTPPTSTPGVSAQYQQQYDAFGNAITAAEAANTAGLATNRAQIEADYQAAKIAQEQANRQYEGGIGVEGIVSGRTHYAPLIQGGVMAQAVNFGLQKVNDLTRLKNKAIFEAEQAVRDKNFELMSKKMDLAKQYEDQVNVAADNARQDAQAARLAASEKRQAEKDEYSRAGDQIKFFASIDTPPPPAELNRMAASFGVPTKQVLALIDATRAAAKAKALPDQFAAMKNIMDLLQGYPAGTKVPMPDGSVLTAFGSSGDYSIVNETDRYGNVRQITTNKLTGKISVQNLGNIGKPLANAAGGVPGEFNPTDKDISLVRRYVQSVPGYKPTDITAILSDPQLFYATIQAALQSNPDFQRDPYSSNAY